ncbi:AAA family ATPase [Brevundimonas sp. S1H14]|uniref:AAA family ATPase n=1 Tax=Brevundimonas sp. S1H14 TaxID=3078084 RepID=UPI0039EB392D
MECTLQADDQTNVPITFVADDDLKATHITLLMGGNGTSKSRLLAACIDHFLGTYEGPSSRKRSGSTFSCATLRSVGPGTDGGPAKMLALSNLVRDRFPYFRNDEADEFYSYLGVRQGTNLTTTGALDQSVGEAVISTVGDSSKLARLRRWLHIFFPGAEIGIAFPRITLAQMKSYASADDGRMRLERRLAGAGRPFRPPLFDDIPGGLAALADRAQSLFRLMLDHPNAETVSDAAGREVALVSLEGSKPLAELTRIYDGVRYSEAARLGIRPSLYIYQDRWMGFDQLSSGEQNLFSVGAKLIAHAVPQSFILIDEPEVSLNVSWQQRYVDLIRESLTDAPGCHVLIATHSPHFVSGLGEGQGSILLVKKEGQRLVYETRSAAYEAWGSEAVLYDVLDVPSASSFAFNREVVNILTEIQNNTRDIGLIDAFLGKTERLIFSDSEPLGKVVSEIRKYRQRIQ